MDNLVILLVHVLSWGLPLAVMTGVPTFIIVLVVKFCKSAATPARKAMVIIGSVVAIPIFLILGLAASTAVQVGGLKLLSKAVGVEDKATTEAVEQPNSGYRR